LIEGLTIQDGSGSANSGIYLIFSNNTQQSVFLRRVVVSGVNRGCVALAFGYGGAAFTGMNDLEAGNTGVTNPCVSINYPSAEVKLTGAIVETSGSKANGGIVMLAGHITVDGFHSEGCQFPININLTTATHSAVVKHAMDGNGCTSLVTLQSTNLPGNFAIFDAVKNGRTTLVTNGQPSGVNRTADATPANGWVAFNP
jgi:hypothetical protein